MSRGDQPTAYIGLLLKECNAYIFQILLYHLKRTVRTKNACLIRKHMITVRKDLLQIKQVASLCWIRTCAEMMRCDAHTSWRSAYIAPPAAIPKPQRNEVIPVRIMTSFLSREGFVGVKSRLNYVKMKTLALKSNSGISQQGDFIANHLPNRKQ